MNTTDIREVVKEKYGQAASRVQSGQNSCCGGAQALDAGLRPDHLKAVRASKRGRSAGAGAAGVARLRQSNSAGRIEAPAKRSSTSARAAESTCCCRRGGSVRQEKPTAST